MFFNNTGKEIAAKIKSFNRDIVSNLRNIHVQAVTNTKTEVKYFQNYFPAFEGYINSLRVPGINFSCRTKEIHGKPIVSYGSNQRCELGDYIVVVKYKNGAVVIGRKVIVCQHKRNYKKSWSINQKQLTLLRDWPTFTFGKVANGYNTFSLNPSRPEFGCFVLVADYSKGMFLSNLYGNAYEISLIQDGDKIKESDSYKFWYDSQIALNHLLIWEFGEPIVPGNDIEKFTSALYRYLDWEEDPPDEFAEFQEPTEEGGFWGVEITVTLGDNHG
jgi:hypothetical protein